MIKVLCVIMTEFFEGGGLTTVMLNYYRELWSHPEYANKLQIDFLSHGSIKDDLREEIESHGCRFFTMPGRKSDPIGHYKTFAKVVSGANYDAMHYNCNSGMDGLELAIAKKHIANRICHVHNSRPSYPFLHSLLKGLLNKSYTHAVATSESAGRWLYGESEFTVLNNAIDVRKFSFDGDVRCRMREELGIGDNCFCVGNVGRMNPGNPKNTGFLLRVYAIIHKECPNTRLVIVGDGELKSEWEALAERLSVSDSVIFSGFRTNVSDYMQAFDVFCFPSSWEGLGMVAIEAQASGLPCLISDAVPSEVLLTDQCKSLPITEASERLWANEVLSIMGSEHNREASRRHVQEQIREGGYDISTEVEKLVDIYLHPDSRCLDD